MKYSLFFLLILLAFGCQPSSSGEADLSLQDWASIQESARGSEVNFMMWQGDPEINAYMNDYVVPSLRDLYGIDLKISNGQGDMIVSVLLTELEAGKSKSEIDMCLSIGRHFFSFGRSMLSMAHLWISFPMPII